MEGLERCGPEASGRRAPAELLPYQDHGSRRDTGQAQPCPAEKLQPACPGVERGVPTHRIVPEDAAGKHPSSQGGLELRVDVERNQTHSNRVFNLMKQV